MKDGKIYEGDFINNIKEGKGVMTTLNERYQGDFKNGLYHGKGIWTTNDG